MSEQPHEEVAQVEDRERTGQPDVDDVLASLERLRDAPVSEHVAVYEAAHERLRGALADAGSDDRPS